MVREEGEGAERQGEEAERKERGRKGKARTLKDSDRKENSEMKKTVQTDNVDQRAYTRMLISQDLVLQIFA
jgi:hypothetical protein